MSIKNILILSGLSISSIIFSAASDANDDKLMKGFEASLNTDLRVFSAPFRAGLTAIAGEPSEFSGDDGRCWGRIRKERMIYIYQLITVPGEERFYAIASATCNGAGIVSGTDQQLVNAVARTFCYAGLPEDNPLKAAIAHAIADNAALAEKAENTLLAVGEHNKFCDILLPKELQPLVQDLPACDHTDSKKCKERFSLIKDHLEALAAKAPTSHKAKVLVPTLQPAVILE